MLRKVMVGILILLAIPAFAQDQSAGLAGSYAVEGAHGSDLVGVNLTISGTGPVYSISSDSANSHVPALALGKIVAAPPVNHPGCEPGTLVRQSDGTLFGLWIDKDVSSTALGVEYYHPRAKTTDFAGTYDVIGSYSSGAQYKGTLTVTQNDKGSYNLTWAYTRDEETPGDIPFSEFGIGTTRKNVLGYTFSSTAQSKCSVIVAEFSTSGFEASYVGQDGQVSGLTGTRQS